MITKRKAGKAVKGWHMAHASHAFDGNTLQTRNQLKLGSTRPGSQPIRSSRWEGVNKHHLTANFHDSIHLRQFLKQRPVFLLLFLPAEQRLTGRDAIANHRRPSLFHQSVGFNTESPTVRPPRSPPLSSLSNFPRKSSRLYVSAHFSKQLSNFVLRDDRHTKLERRVVEGWRRP